MDIKELENYNLGDAVKFHNRLNPKIWGRDEHLLPEVHEKLRAIAADFREFLGVSDLAAKDITVSGSNAAYSYTPHSDLDLHLVVEFAEDNEIYQELFNAKKVQYNSEHNLTISGIPVELYVQNVAKSPVSQGEYSVLNNKWVQVPRKKRAKIDDTCVRAKVEDLDARIHSAIKSDDLNAITKLCDKIKHMRQAGLDQHGEFGCENIAFKILRANGCIKALWDARGAARDKELSLKEQQPKQKHIWGFAEDATLTPYGVNPNTRMVLDEAPLTEDIVNEFIDHVIDQLGITTRPEIVIHNDPEWSTEHRSFGMYEPDTHRLNVSLPNRHLLDVLRTTAHELVHCRQNQEHPLPDEAGDTGSKWENQANAQAGVIMRAFADAHPEYFNREQQNEDQFDASLNENSGYIPTEAEKDDRRFVMALSVDVKPGQTGKEANKLGLQTDKQGKPALLMKSANLLEQQLAMELEEFGLLESEFITEINMSHTSLSQLAGKISGALVGLEFEMIVPNVERNNDDYEEEVDMDADELASIGSIMDFFRGDHNSRRDVERAIADIWEEFRDSDFLGEKKQELWNDSAQSEVEELLRNGSHAEEINDTAIEQVREENPDMPEVSGNNEFDNLVSKRFDELIASRLDDEMSNHEAVYDEAFDNWSENWDNDSTSDDYIDDWLDSNYRHMSDIGNGFNLSWPYYYARDNESNDNASVKDLAIEFMEAIGESSVAVAEGYHGDIEKYSVGVGKTTTWKNIGRTKPNDCFTIEPDGSLDGGDDTGLEFVSPPMPVAEMFQTMRKVQKWAGRVGAYTGHDNNTGLHMNISVPGYSLDKLDYVKTALLLGDEHVIREFERFGNMYSRPAIEKVRALVNQKPVAVTELLEKMKSQLNAAASKLIHGAETEKFTSINTQNNRVEFRSPGGDYLSDIANNPKKIEDTINRMVVVLDAAVHPEKFKQEYQKKLYKLLTGQKSGRDAKTGEKHGPSNNNDDLLNIFSRYAAGELPKQALKSFVRQAQLERTVKRDNAKTAAAAAPVPTLNYLPTNQGGNYVILGSDDITVYRFAADNSADAQTVLRQWNSEATRRPPAPGVTYAVRYDPHLSYGQPRASRASQTQQLSANHFHDTSLPIWHVRPIDVDHHSNWVQVRATDAADAVVQAKAMRPDIYDQYTPEDLVVLNNQMQVVPHLQEPVDAPMPNLPGSTQDIQQQRNAAHLAAAQDAHAEFAARPQLQWRVMMGDEQVYQITAATQGEANEATRRWLTLRSIEFNNEYQGREVTVVPIADSSDGRQPWSIT